MSEFWEAVAAGDATPATWPIARILSQSAAEHRRALTKANDAIVGATRETYIYGAGQNGRRLGALLRTRGLNPIGFIDDTPHLQGTSVDGLAVSASDVLERATPATLVVVSMFSPSHSFLRTRGRLEKFSCRVIPLHTALLISGAEALPFNFLDMPDHYFQARASLLALNDRLVDDAARERLWRFLVFGLTLDEKYFPDLDTERFQSRAAPGEAIFVDGGAFDGDTIRAFLAACENRFKLIHAFEPDRSNFARLGEYVNGLPAGLKAKVRLHNVGLWQETDQLAYASVGSPASRLSSTGSNKIAVCALDDVCDEAGAYIVKLDVEGAEEEAILGMSRLIKEQAPYIEVAVYHKPSDLYRLPELILSLNDRYRFDFRAFGHDGADMMLCATTL